MSQHDFGELRGLLEQRPSVVAFENLLYFLDYHQTYQFPHPKIEIMRKLVFDNQ